MIKQEITREILEELYISKQYSLKEIALVYKTTATVIQRKMIKFELKTRSASEAKTIKRNRSAANITENQKEQVKLLFKNKETRANIAKTVELKYKDVNGILVEAGLILEKREVKNLTPLQRQVILGSLLGDGCITNSKGKVAYQTSQNNTVFWRGTIRPHHPKPCYPPPLSRGFARSSS